MLLKSSKLNLLCSKIQWLQIVNFFGVGKKSVMANKKQSLKYFSLYLYALAFVLLTDSTLSRNAETIDFARLTSHPVRGWTGKNKTFCSPGTQNGRRVIKVYMVEISFLEPYKRHDYHIHF